MTSPELVTVNGPGYYQMGEEQYHADPCPKPSLSASIATTLVVDSAAEAKHAHPRLTPFSSLSEAEQLARQKKAENKQFDLGNVAHYLLLGKGRELAVLDFDDYKKKAAQDARDDAFEAGLQPCLTKLHDQAQEMADAAIRQIATDPDNFDAFAEDAGESEVTVLWQEPTAPGKMWMRARPDRLMNDRRRIYDYKTFAPGPDPDGFVKYLVREGRDVQDPFYSRGVAMLEGCPWDEVIFRWIVQSPQPPYVLSTIELLHDPEAPVGEDNAPSPRRWSYDRSQWAIDEWARCAVAQTYPGYVPRTHYVGIPPYAMTGWALRLQQYEAGLRLLAAAQ